MKTKLKKMQKVLGDDIMNFATSSTDVDELNAIKGVFSPNPPFLLRYQGELLGLWDPQNRDLRRKLTPETKF